MHPIKLTYCNRSAATITPVIAIQVVPGFVWKVIRNCAQGETHPFEFAREVGISIKDSNGNLSPQSMISDTEGAHFNIEMGLPQQELLVRSNTPPASDLITVHNTLKNEKVSLLAYRSGNVMQVVDPLIPGEEYEFKFRPKIYFAVRSEAEEGTTIDVSPTGNTPIDLTGIASADIVLTGGGAGPTAMPFHFALENVVRA